MSFNVVVARFKENDAWIERLKSVNNDLNVFVYNKFEGKNLLPNVGREAHTYIHHIVNHYDCNDDDHYMFLQGNPFDHENPKGIIEEIARNYSDYQHYDFFPLNVELCKDLNGLPASRRTGFPIGFLYEKIFGKGTSPQVFESPQGAQFLVKGKFFRSLTLNQWKLLLSFVSNSNAPVEAHCIEKMWKTLFLGKSSKTYEDIKYDKYPMGYLQKLELDKKVNFLPDATTLGYDV